MFTNDISMEFGTDQCAYLSIENGKRKTLEDTIDINGLHLEELEEGDIYSGKFRNETLITFSA